MVVGTPGKPGSPQGNMPQPPRAASLVLPLDTRRAPRVPGWAVWESAVSDGDRLPRAQVSPQCPPPPPSLTLDPGLAGHTAPWRHCAAPPCHRGGATGEAAGPPAGEPPAHRTSRKRQYWGQTRPPLRGNKHRWRGFSVGRGSQRRKILKLDPKHLGTFAITIIWRSNLLKQ